MPQEFRKQLPQVWEKHASFLHSLKSGSSQHTLEDLISRLFSAGPQYYYIHDFLTGDMEYVSDSVRGIMGIGPDNITVKDIIDRCHPDDVPFIMMAEDFLMGKIRELGVDAIDQVKVSYCFRERVTDGSYHLFHLQWLVFGHDAQGRSSRILNIHTDISHLTDVNNHRITIQFLDTGKLMQFDFRDRVELPPLSLSFTRSEIRVLQLLAKGMTTPQIAHALSISPHTVRTHRKNLLQKSGMKNTSALVAHGMAEGIL